MKPHPSHARTKNDARVFLKRRSASVEQMNNVVNFLPDRFWLACQNEPWHVRSAVQKQTAANHRETIAAMNNARSSGFIKSGPWGARACNNVRRVNYRRRWCR